MLSPLINTLIHTVSPARFTFAWACRLISLVTEAIEKKLDLPNFPRILTLISEWILVFMAFNPVEELGNLVHLISQCVTKLESQEILPSLLPIRDQVMYRIQIALNYCRQSQDISSSSSTTSTFDDSIVFSLASAPPTCLELKDDPIEKNPPASNGVGKKEPLSQVQIVAGTVNQYTVADPLRAPLLSSKLANDCSGTKPLTMRWWTLFCIQWPDSKRANMLTSKSSPPTTPSSKS